MLAVFGRAMMFLTSPYAGLSFGAGIFAQGKRPGDTANTYFLPSQARVDAMVRYQLPVYRFSVQLNAYNLADETLYGGTLGDRFSVNVGHLALSLVRSIMRCSDMKHRSGNLRYTAQDNRFGVFCSENFDLRNRNIVRPFLIYIHRYVGLLLVPFLVIVGLTGSALAFYHELDRWFNPSLLTVPIPDDKMSSICSIHSHCAKISSVKNRVLRSTGLICILNQANPTDCSSCHESIRQQGKFRNSI